MTVYATQRSQFAVTLVCAICMGYHDNQHTLYKQITCKMYIGEGVGSVT